MSFKPLIVANVQIQFQYNKLQTDISTLTNQTSNYDTIIQ